MNYIRATACFFVLGSFLCAQRAPRYLQAPRQISLAPLAELSDQSGLEVSLADMSHTVSTGSLSTPGALVSWSSPAPLTRHYLAAGRSTTQQGIIQHWTWAGGNATPVLASTYVAPNTDVVGVAFDAGRAFLYYLDVASQSLSRASWDGNGPLPSPGNGWSPILTSATVPQLVSIEDLHLEISTGGNGPVLMIAPWTPHTGSFDQHTWFLLVDDTQTPAVVQLVAAEPEALFSIADHSLAEGETQVLVNVDLGLQDTLELVRIDTGQVLGSAATSGSSPLSVPSSQPLEIGLRYLVRSDPGASSVLAGECFARYGTPQVTPSGIRIGHVQHTPRMAINEDGVIAFVELTVDDNALSADLPITAWCGVAFRDATTGQDPVVITNGTAYLQTTNFVDASGVIDHLTAAGTLQANGLVIPDDPALIGIVILTQFVIYDQDFHVSDVQGAVTKAAIP